MTNAVIVVVFTAILASLGVFFVLEIRSGDRMINDLGKKASIHVKQCREAGGVAIVNAFGSVMCFKRDAVISVNGETP